ncbi:type IV toxin-antitoxin system AbiEi family antitoxin domain-containing protein [Corynebacterium glucuronolyticum]
MGSGNILENLETIASDQWGIVTTAQAQREGITRVQINRLVQKGVLYKSSHGVYYLPSASMGALSDIQASWISLDPKHFLSERWEDGPKIVVSHESAAAIHHIGNLIPQADTFSAIIRKQTSRSGIKILSNQKIDSEDIVNVDGLPVTSVKRTVVDLAAQRIEREYLSMIVADALEKEDVGYLSLASRLNKYCTHYGATSGRELVDKFYLENAPLESQKDILERANTITNRLNEQTSPAFKTVMESLSESYLDKARPLLADSVAMHFAEHGEKLGKMLQPIVMQAVEAQMKNWIPQIYAPIASEELEKALKAVSLWAGNLETNKVSDALLKSQLANLNRTIPAPFGSSQDKAKATANRSKPKANENQGKKETGEGHEPSEE